MSPFLADCIVYLMVGFVLLYPMYRVYSIYLILKYVSKHIAIFTCNALIALISPKEDTSLIKEKPTEEKPTEEKYNNTDISEALGWQ